ncbi:zinc ribbon domain-containing protein [Haloarcula sp. CBA1130]|uniref:zinc ribbon domain-containing protein n=1 Tax=unclassified Haloarcula TaxID=2624677 RepID=UPI001243E777|nr:MULTISPECIES: zinc ribbon domain-containing protein [unclassified Haloarcula]KAA9397932.1 zinc ribbon domain-containing protein [Haloarcula sp. CBA1129]KAA9402379.1 zinc ribbon domain-containing protein [Haloarcula sp. CBA1130]
MQRGRLGLELRESAALLRAESWLFVGVGIAWLVYSGWVLATGLLLTQVPGLERTVPVTLAGQTVSLRTVLAAGLWLLSPSLATVVLVNRRLRNSYGNLVEAYRLDHPSLLLVLPGTVLLGCLLGSLILGQQRLLTVVAFFGTVHLVVRTVAYGHRVYTLSVPPLLSLLVCVSAVSLSTGWVLQMGTASGVSSALSPWLARAGVGPIAETALQLLGVRPSQATALFIAVPGVLASAYLFVQLLAGTVVRIRAPLSNPHRRPDQRFPIMPPVGVVQNGDESSATERAVDATPDSGEQTEDGTAAEDVDSDAEPPGHTGTRVFSPDEAPTTEPPAHESVQDTAQLSDDAAQPETAATDSGTDTESETGDTNEPASATDEAWMDDTSVFTPGDRNSGQSYCSECGESLPPDADTCPSCGDPVDG